MGRESQTCRVCTKRSKDFVELQTIYNRKPQITYLEIYNICTQLNALVDDDLPKILCSTCKKDLKSSYKFVEKAREADEKLRELLYGTVGQKLRNRRKQTHQQESETISLHLSKPEPDYEDNNSDDGETNFEEIKPEFINCTKDPLEDSDIEGIEKSEDEINWVPNDFFEEKTAIIEDDDDEDDKPLKELIDKQKLNTASTVQNPDYVSSDIFNVSPNDNTYSSGNEDDMFNDKMIEVSPDPPTTQEAQIFPQGRYMCKICKKTYFTADGLKAHMIIHMPKKKKVKRIRGPNKKNSKNKKKKKNATDDEDDDEDENTQEKTEKADKKDEDKTLTTAVESDVKKKRKLKPPKPKKMFPCSVCGKHMISASKLRYHMVMHTGEKDFLCTMCPKAYSTIYALKHHMRTHTGERPYECKFCGDKFTRPTTLKSHMRRHTGERPYGCDICGKRFIQHSSMTTHMKLNHMAKTIGCPHCDKKYARQTDLNTHLLSHTGDKPFSCSLCPSRFIRQANLNKHMNQHHLAKNNKTSKSLSLPLAVQKTILKRLETDEPLTEEMVELKNSLNSNRQAMEPANNDFVDRNTDKLRKMTVVPKLEPQPVLIQNNQISVDQKISAASSLATQPTNNVYQQKINFAIAGNQFNAPPQNQKVSDTSPHPKLANARSQSRPLQKGLTAVKRLQEISSNSPPENEEMNSSNGIAPHSMVSSPPQMRHPQLQQPQNNVLPQPAPPPQQQQRLPNNENNMPLSMSIAGIPGGIPTHSMLSGSSGIVQMGHHTQIGSVDHLKSIQPPVDNLTNLLGQVIDPERIGRSVEEIMPWTWSNTS